MAATYVIFDVDIRDMTQYQTFMAGVKPAVEAAGGKYLARGGAHKVHEGDWEPRRIVLFEFPSAEAWEAFYNGPVYREPARQKASKAKVDPSEDSFCRICSPIARLWGKKAVKNGPLRAICSRRSFCRAGSQSLKPIRDACSSARLVSVEGLG
jgi:uncharacterized protein (DUF1330 family)